MKRILWMTLAIITTAVMSQAQTSTSTGQKTTPSSAQAATTTSATAPGKKKVPEAKTKEEFDAYQAAAAKTSPAEAETAVAEFAAKFPASELRTALYSNLMLKYQRSNNPEKTVEIARKVLSMEGDNTVALVLAATVISEKTRETDLDREDRYAEAVKDAQKAIDTIDTGLVVPANATPEQVATFKKALTSMAEGAIGMVELQKKNDAAAEIHLKKAVEISAAQPDPTLYLRLALAQDHQKKYADALQSANRAVDLSASDPRVGQVAKQERDRLMKLAPAGSAMNKTQTPAPLPKK